MLSLHQLALSFGSFDRDEPDILEKPAPPMCWGLKATHFVPYFNYPGNLTDVEGSITTVIAPKAPPPKVLPFPRILKWPSLRPLHAGRTNELLMSY